MCTLVSLNSWTPALYLCGQLVASKPIDDTSRSVLMLDKQTAEQALIFRMQSCDVGFAL